MAVERLGSPRLRDPGRFGLRLLWVMCCFPVLMGSDSVRAQGNLITNGDFSDGLVGWNRYEGGSGDGGGSVAVSEGQLRLSASANSFHGGATGTAEAKQRIPLSDLSPVLTGFLSTDTYGNSPSSGAQAHLELIYSNASGEEVSSSSHRSLPPGGISLETDCGCATPEAVADVTLRFTASAWSIPGPGSTIATASLTADDLVLTTPLEVDWSGLLHR